MIAAKIIYCFVPFSLKDFQNILVSACGHALHYNCSYYADSVCHECNEKLKIESTEPIEFPAVRTVNGFSNVDIKIQLEKMSQSISEMKQMIADQKKEQIKMTDQLMYA